MDAFRIFWALLVFLGCMESLSCRVFASLDKDAYSQNDNPINPYSQFSEPGEDSVYKAGGKDEVDRRKKALTAALKRFENTPEYITTKQAQGLKASLTKVLTM